MQLFKTDVAISIYLYSIYLSIYLWHTSITPHARAPTDIHAHTHAQVACNITAAMAYLDDMRKAGISPNLVTYHVVLGTCQVHAPLPAHTQDTWTTQVVPVLHLSHSVESERAREKTRQKERQRVTTPVSLSLYACPSVIPTCSAFPILHVFRKMCPSLPHGTHVCTTSVLFRTIFLPPAISSPYPPSLYQGAKNVTAAFEMFEELEQLGLRPRTQTFNWLIKACVAAQDATRAFEVSFLLFIYYLTPMEKLSDCVWMCALVCVRVRPRGEGRGRHFHINRYSMLTSTRTHAHTHARTHARTNTHTQVYAMMQLRGVTPSLTTYHQLAAAS
jgi:hypothetical protein